MEEKVIFRIGRSDLLSVLKATSKIVSDKSILPVYTYILFEIKDGSLTLTGTNTGIQIEANVDLIESSSDMSFCADKMIAGILESLPEQPLIFEITKTTTIESRAGGEVKTVSVEVCLTHASGQVSVPGFDSEYFTKMKDFGGDKFNIPIANLKAGIAKTKPFMGEDPLRPAMNSVYMDIKEDCVVFVATNNATLSRFTDYSLSGMAQNGFILDSDFVNILSSTLGGTKEDECQISASGNNISFQIGRVKIASRLIEGRYADYNSIFPQGPSTTATIDVSRMSSALGRMILLSNEANYHMVVADIDPSGISLSTKDDRFNRMAEEGVDCSPSGSIRIGVNGSDFSKALKSLNGNAVISLTSPDRVILIEPKNQGEHTHHSLICTPVLID